MKVRPAEEKRKQENQESIEKVYRDEMVKPTITMTW